MAEETFNNYSKRLVVRQQKKMSKAGMLPDKAYNTKDVLLVWGDRLPNGNKGMFTSVYPDGMYYVITYLADKNEFFVDSYEMKWSERVDKKDVKCEVL